MYRREAHAGTSSRVQLRRTQRKLLGMYAATLATMNQLALRHAILGAIAATACGGTGTPSDGGSDVATDACLTMCCNLPPPQDYMVTYDVCSIVASDAGHDASTDAGEDSGDAGVCYTSCVEACQAMPPSNTNGVGSCVGDVDGGDGGVRVAECQILQLCGRMTGGLDEPATLEMIAHAAWLEAASIEAFRRLARELEAHGAPDDLVRRARGCARDEARHARLMARLATKRGARVPPVTGRARGTRDLESIARENAVEGCVGETFGALFAEWYARRASDPELREVLASIAPDELRHATLGWDVADWAEGKLDAPALARVREARREAVTDVVRETRHDPDALRLASAMVSSGVWG